MWQRISSAREVKQAQQAFRLSAIILLFFYILLTMIGIYGRAALGDGVQPDTSGFVYFLVIIRNSSNQYLTLYGNFFLSILALGVFSALLSTADTNLNVVSIAISKLILHKKWEQFELSVTQKLEGNAEQIEKTIINRTRSITLLLGILGIVVAKFIPDIVNLIVTAASSIMVFIPTVFAALYKKTVNVYASVISIILGFMVLICFLFFTPKIAFLPATFAAFIAYILVQLILQARINKGKNEQA
jgi:Na+/proline symporter